MSHLPGEELAKAISIKKKMETNLEMAKERVSDLCEYCFTECQMFTSPWDGKWLKSGMGMNGKWLILCGMEWEMVKPASLEVLL